MNTNITLTEDEKDCLQELMNISYGSATAAIANIIDKFATLNIPKIKLANTIEFKDYLDKKLDDEKTYFISNQLINGQFSGENIFIMDEMSLVNLAKEFDLEDEEINENELKDVMLEISNIISSTTISTLCSLIDSDVIFSPPSIKVVTSPFFFENRYEIEYQHIIIISTELVFEDKHIQGELIILSKDESITYIKNALNKILDEY